MIEKVKERLLSLGVVTTYEDTNLLNITIEKVTTYIKTFCNLSEIPNTLVPIGVDLIVGEFLHIKKSLGLLYDIDFSPIEKSIKEGDTSITFAIGEGDKTKEERFDEVIHLLISSGKDSLKHYRKFRW